jgi:hypothetical protein
MKHLAIILCLTGATPALAQEHGDGLSLMERGAQMLMEGLLREMEPALDNLQGLAEEFGPSLRDFATQMGPSLRGLLDEVEDWSVYEAPEILENGDIIIRRKPKQDKITPEDPTEEIDI